MNALRMLLRFIEAILDITSNTITKVLKWVVYAFLAVLVIGTGFVYLIAHMFN